MPENDEILRQLFAVFREEQAEHASAIRALLAAAREEELPGDGPRLWSAAELEEAYRRIHSLKGAARAVDLPEVETVAHQMESILSGVRAGNQSVLPSRLYALLEDTLDVCEALTLTADAESKDAVAAAHAAAESLLREMASVLQYGEPAATRAPAASPAAPSDSRPVPVTTPTNEEFVRLRAQHLDDLLTVARQLLLEAERQRPTLMDLRRLERDLLGALSETASGEQTNTDALVNARRLVRRTYRRQEENVWRLSRVVQRLHDSVRSARTVTADTIAEGMDRMLTTLARQQGKEAVLDVVGGEIAIDRQMAQALRDPLTHLLRNTVSHGIESSSERAALGKPPHGTVRLRFGVQGARLEVEVEDDGRGVDTVALRRVSERLGLRATDAGSDLGADEISRLIFAPGFSTAETPDRIAGRGLGLSIVSQAVSRLGGEVRFLAKPSGAGTLFRLSLPLSLLTERLLLVESAGRTYGIPTFAVERLYRVPTARRETVAGRETVRPDASDPVPLTSLDTLLPAPTTVVGANPSVAGDQLPVVVLRSGERRIALSVTAFRNEIEAVIRPLGPYLSDVSLANGSVILEDGSIALALVPGELAARAAARAAAPPRRQPAPAPVRATADAAAAVRATRSPGTRTILVVDDSITTRALMKSILEAQEYQVRIATDGAEALAILRESANRQDSPVHLVVSDIEMPRMNGFDLLRAIKEAPRLAAIPVILVTSRAAFEDREAGLSLGADAYIVKQRFDHRELLEAIEQLVL